MYSLFVLTGRGREILPLLQERGYDHVAITHDLGEAVGIILDSKAFAGKK